MKVTIDRDLCTGCELCATTCPDVFEMDDDGLAKVKVDPVPATWRTPRRKPRRTARWSASRSANSRLTA